MEQQNCVEEITKSEKQLSGSVILKGVKKSGQNFKETRRGLNQQKHKMTLKPAMISANPRRLHRHHFEPRVQFYVPKEESFPTPLKYVDVTITTHTSLHVLQEKRINDYWNADVDRTLSVSWTGFTKFTLLNEKLPPGSSWSGCD